MQLRGIDTATSLQSFAERDQIQDLRGSSLLFTAVSWKTFVNNFDYRLCLVLEDSLCQNQYFSETFEKITAEALCASLEHDFTQQVVLKAVGVGVDCSQSEYLRLVDCSEYLNTD